MLKDIPELKVTDVAVAVVPDANELSQMVWNVYLINLKTERIESILVSSSGYGYKDGEEIKTSTLRHFIDLLEPQSFCLIEPIISDVFELSNEYWVSFYQQKKIYDRKYVFLPGAIKEEFFTSIPVINKKGVLIK